MRVENPMARDFYRNEAADQNWSSRTLERVNLDIQFPPRMEEAAHEA